MRRIAAAVVFLVLVGVTAPTFAQSDQTYWHDRAERQAKKAKKRSDKAYNKQVKIQKKALKKQRKQAAKEAKMWKERR